ncbi:hypothetical protein Y1Q_0014405 [Alligator mississippiensis]|uniref:Uncharacterized protein n=1 Tax=Alligator mississippiensis TaxID=8496 RepID=A0A151PCU2_ALLMI|nr:hypothetical protein Y1Q_0014405 [Alligator mississippiensis]
MFRMAQSRYLLQGLREKLKNWRLITLLNFDYNLLAERFKSILRTVIHKDQLCGSVAILNLALENAYDRACHQFLFSMLEWMGVPLIFIGWIKTLYMDVISEVQVNGFLNAWIAVESEFQQDCLLSPILLICAIERTPGPAPENPEGYVCVVLGHQGRPLACFDLFTSCIRSTLWKARNLLMYKHMDLEVVDCVEMALSKLQTYYQTTVAEDSEDMTKSTWQRDTWHRIFQLTLSGETHCDCEEDAETTRSEDSSNDSDSSSKSFSGSWSDSNMDNG